MIKKVNIRASVPIKDFKPPIYGTCNGIEMTTGEILKCLCKRAIVDEVLPDGSTIRLDLKNYYTDNTPKTTTEVPAADEVQVVETSVPVDEMNQAVECETTTTDVADAVDAIEEHVPEEDTTVATVVTDETDAIEEHASEEEAIVADEADDAEDEDTATAVENAVANKATTYNNTGKKKKRR